MRRTADRLSTSGPNSRTWRVSRMPRPASEGAEPRAPSDLGSDDDWHLTMGSDSDVDDLESVDPPNIALHWPPKPLQLQGASPAKSPASSTLPLPQPETSTPDEGEEGSLTPRPPDEYEVDEVHQPILFPNYRLQQASAHKPCTGWADRPRMNGPSTPVREVPISHISSGLTHGSDSAHSSQAGSMGSGSALRISTRTSSDASDGSRKTAIKSVSFLTQKDLYNKPLVVNDVSTSISASSSTRSVEASNVERKMSAIRLSLNNARSHMPGNVLLATRPQPRRFSMEQLTSDGGLPDTANTMPPFQTGLYAREGPSFLPHDASIFGPIAEQRFSSKSDGTFHRRNSEYSYRQAERPSTMPPPELSDSFDIAPTRETHGSDGHRQPLTSPASVLGKMSRWGRHPLFHTTTRDLSFLECIVEVLKGTVVLKKKNFIYTTEAELWLDPDMHTLHYKTYKKGQPIKANAINMGRVRKLKGSEKEITIEVFDEKKSFDFIFPSKERADIWLSGLCCLVPSNAIVKSRNQRMQLENEYDPFRDTWSGKPLATRRRLGEFILLGTFGRGSFAKVKLALSEKDRRFYAVKILFKDNLRKQLRISPMYKINAAKELTVDDVNEIVVMRALNHENVVRMKSLFDDEEDDKLYIVIEFVAKGPIMNSSKLQGAMPLPEERARTIFVDVLTGLHYLHSNNVIHRDIKPENLLQTADGTVKISDFGAAHVYRDDGPSSDDNDSQQFRSTVGTPAFSAPEMCMSEKSPLTPERCYAADIWSLGATLFYMVYGRVPFIARSVFEIYDAICTQEVVFPDTPYVSKSLRSLLRQMLERSPEKRITIASIIRSPWLTECADVAGKLATLRSALLRRAEVNSNPR